MGSQTETGSWNADCMKKLLMCFSLCRQQLSDLLLHWLWNYPACENIKIVSEGTERGEKS